MRRLHLTLLGGFEARLGADSRLDIASKKTRALLAYLALPPGRQHSRDKLMGLLWSDRGDEQARNSLRQALTELGYAIGSDGAAALLKGRDTLALDPANTQADAVLFEQLARSGNTGDLRHAASLYRGELLEGFGIRDRAFEEWLADERRRHHDMAITVFQRLAEREKGADALAAGQRLLALDPLREEGHRLLMRLYAEAGETAAALRQYEACRELLRAELGIAPSAETEALHQEIRLQPGHIGAINKPELTSSSWSPNAPPTATKPTIAVLPFTNLGDDPEQQYLSDGITEDIISELSRFHLVFVVARNSSFQYRDKAIDVRQVASELGAQYIASGSVRRLHDRIRINVQLIDAATGKNLWSERYDRDFRQIYELQDEVVSSIAATLPGLVHEAGARSAGKTRAGSLNAFDCYLRARALFLTELREKDAAIHTLLDQAIGEEPEFAAAYAMLAALALREWWRDSIGSALDRALVLAKKAVSLGAYDSECRRVLGMACLYSRKFDDAWQQAQRAAALNPNDTDTMIVMSWLYSYTGKPQEALEWHGRAARLNPKSPQWHNSARGLGLFVARRYADVVAVFNRVDSDLVSWDHLYLAACYGYLGNIDKAKEQVEQFNAKRTRPTLTPIAYAAQEPFEHESEQMHLIGGLRRAGSVS